MRKFALLPFAILVLAILYLMPSASGLQAGLTVIPSKVTANAGFIAVADPDPLPNEVVRVDWQVIGEGVNEIGLFPNIGNQWICYFSNTDTSSICGPSPFTSTTVDLASDWQIVLLTTNQDGDTATETHSVEVGGIDLTPSILKAFEDSKNVSIIIYPKQLGFGIGVSGVGYSAYYSNMTPIKTGDLDWEDGISGYKGNITLGFGDYFIAFEADESGAGTDFGGVVVSVSMERAGVVPGVGYVVEGPNITKSILFSHSGQSFQGSGSFTNIGDVNLVNLSMDVLSGLTSYLSVIPNDPDLLEAGESGGFSYTVENIPAGSGLWINTWVDVLANVSGNDTVVGRIFFDIAVSVQGTGGDECLGQSDWATCSGDDGRCVLQTCVVGAECIDNDGCLGSNICQGLRCVSPGGCLLGSTCYQGADSSDCPTEDPPTVYTGTNCDLTDDEVGICCNSVECLSSTDCSDPTPYCLSSNECVECLSPDDCDEGYTCNINKQCEAEFTPCPSGGSCLDAGDGCPSEYTSTGSPCSEAGIADGICCEQLAAPEGDMTFIFIIAIVVIIGVGAWYYFKKYKKGGGGGGRGKRGRSKEEEELEKELEEEF